MKTGFLYCRSGAGFGSLLVFIPTLVLAQLNSTDPATPDLTTNSHAWQTPPFIFDFYEWMGPYMTEALYLDRLDALCSLPAPALALHPWYIEIADGWQGYRDANGLLHEDLTKFPHGLRYLVDKIHEKGVLVSIYNELGPNSTSVGAGVGSQGHYQDDAFNFIVNFAVDAVRSDNPPPDPWTLTWNSLTVSEASEFKNWLAIYAGHPIPLTSTGWNLASDPLPCAVDAWYIVLDLGDSVATAGQDPATSLWTNYWPHLALSGQMAQFGCPGSFQSVEVCHLSWNSAYYKMDVLFDGAVHAVLPFTAQESSLAYSQMTNAYLWEALCNVSPAPQEPDMTLTNGIQVWHRDLTNDHKLLFVVNPSTNLTSSAEFDVSCVGFSDSQYINMLELEFITNTVVSGTYSNEIPPMTGLLYDTWALLINPPSHGRYK